MTPSGDPIGGGPVGSVPGGRAGVPAGSLVFVDVNGTFHFTTRTGMPLEGPSCGPSAIPGQMACIASLEQGGYVVAQMPGGLHSQPYVQILDSQFSVVGTQDILAYGVASNRHDGFYVWKYGTRTLYRISPDNVVVDSWELSVARILPHGSLAVAENDTRVYVDNYPDPETGADELAAIDLPNTTPFAYRGDDGAFEPANTGLVVSPDGSVAVSWRVNLSNNPAAKIFRFDHELDWLPGLSLGSREYTYTRLISMCVDLDGASFWCSYLEPYTGLVHVRRFRNSDLALLDSFTKTDGSPIQWTTASMAVVGEAVEQVELRQLNYPTSAGSTDFGPPTHPYRSVAIPAGGVAYITGEPRMPKLRVRVVQPPDGATDVEWSMKITSERTERGNRDDVTLLPSTLGVTATWAIDEALEAKGKSFVGGRCLITYRFKNVSGYIGPEKSLPFTIRGKNPPDDVAKAYVQGIQGDFRFLWAIVQHESREDRYIYNQFNAFPLSVAETPNFGPEDGWGIAQIERATTEQTYNWKLNIDQALVVYRQQNGSQTRYWRRAMMTFAEAALPGVTPPANRKLSGTTTEITAQEAGAITAYNGAQNIVPIPRLVGFDGTTSDFVNAWYFYTDRPAGQRWVLRPTPPPPPPYLWSVIFNEYEGNIENPIQ